MVERTGAHAMCLLEDMVRWAASLTALEAVCTIATLLPLAYMLLSGLLRVPLRSIALVSGLVLAASVGVLATAVEAAVLFPGWMTLDISGNALLVQAGALLAGVGLGVVCGRPRPPYYPATLVIGLHASAVLWAIALCRSPIHALLLPVEMNTTSTVLTLLFPASLGIFLVSFVKRRHVLEISPLRLLRQSMLAKVILVALGATLYFGYLELSAIPLMWRMLLAWFVGALIASDMDERCFIDTLWASLLVLRVLLLPSVWYTTSSPHTTGLVRDVLGAQVLGNSDVLMAMLLSVVCAVNVWVLLAMMTPREVHEAPYEQSAYNKAQRPRPFPAAFPHGWYKVASSDHLLKGDVKAVSALGREFVVFRTHSGKPVVLDAYCRHLGANLGVGGRVLGENIECPFHGWQYGTDGTCTSIPYSQEASAEMKQSCSSLAWPVHEYGGMVCMYFHSEYDARMRDDPSFPPYLPPPLPYIDDKSWIKGGEWGTRSTMHMQDFGENAVDYAHFDHLHRVISFEFLSPFAFLQHEVQWKEGLSEFIPYHRRHIDKQPPVTPETSYFSSFIDYAKVYFSLWPVDRSETSRSIIRDVDLASVPLWKKPFYLLSRPFCAWPSFAVNVVTLVGPNSIVYFRFFTPVGQVLLIKTYLPKGAVDQYVEDVWWSERSVPSFLVNFIVGEAQTAFKDDVKIWNQKTYVAKPRLHKGDGPIYRMRKWYKQFYPRVEIEMEEEDTASRSPGRTAPDLSW